MKSATVVNYLGEILTLQLNDPESSGFKVFDIEGLGPVKADINTSKISTVDGVIYNSSTVGGRNIVFKLGFTDNPSIEANRLKSYRYFPIGKMVTLIFDTGTRLAGVTGYVESNAPTIFSAEGTTQVSIVCESAYFLDVSEDGVTNTLFFNVEALFEFPFSNESLTEDLLEFSRLNTNYERTVVYEGDGEVGLKISIKALGNVGNVVIYDPVNNEAVRINSTTIASMTGTGISAGDEILINTNKGSKSVKLFRRGTTTNILNAFERGSSWLSLSKGENTFSYSATSGVANLQITMESLTYYEGL